MTIKQQLSRSRYGAWLLRIWTQLLQLMRKNMAIFEQANCMQAASSLTITSLLSLVPFIAVSFSLLTTVPGFQQFGDKIQDFIFQNFVPSAGSVIETHITQFVSKARSMSGVGAISLMVTALLLMNTIEKTINQVFQSRNKRNFLQRFIIFWTVLSLGPLCLGTSFFMTSYVTSLNVWKQAGTDFNQFFQTILPFMFTFSGLLFMYLVIPTRRVQFRHALQGAFVAAIFFEISKKGFALYVTLVPSYEVIFGALSALPIFIIWVYFGWIVVLWGASLTFSLSVFRAGALQTDAAFMLACVILSKVWQGFAQGKPYSRRELAEVLAHYPPSATENVLAQLQRSRLIAASDRDWLPGQHFDQVTLAQLYHWLPWKLPEGQQVPDCELKPLFEQLQQQIDQTLDKPLAEVVTKMGVIRE